VGGGAFGGVVRAFEQGPGFVQLPLRGGLDYIHIRFLVWRALREAGRTVRIGSDSARDRTAFPRGFAPLWPLFTRA